MRKTKQTPFKVALMAGIEESERKNMERRLESGRANYFPCAEWAALDFDDPDTGRMPA